MIDLYSTPQQMMLSLRGGGYEYVDLDLPSGLKWAKCNIGAATETEYGDYFMWGSTKANTPDECTWAKAPFNGGNTSYNADAFNQVKDTVCPNGVLAKEYDAATQIMGSDWRMPTQDECKELIDNTEYKWFDDFNSSGVSGGNLTSKINGNSIFIPAAGNCYDGSVSLVGNYGGVWSSSLDTSGPSDAWYLYFNSDDYGMDYYYRYNGRSVRGVHK